MKLRKFQEEGRDFLVKNKVALLADQMRLGKSAQTIAAADKLGAKKILVVCPATCKITWQRQFAQWSDRDRSLQIVSGTKAIISDADIIIINYDIIWRPEIKKQLLKKKFSVGIIDESHYLAGRKSNRTKALLDSNDRTPILSRCVYTWFVSGTPLLNRPRDLFPILAACAPEVIAPYTSYRAFTRHFCGGYWDGIQWLDKGATNTEELNRRLHSGFMLRRLRKDHIDELPPTYQMIPLAAEGNKIKTYMAKEIAWDKDDAEYQKLDGDEHIATVRRELGLYKIPAAIQYIKHIMTMEDKLVVFAYHKEVMRELYERLTEFNPALLVGGMSGERKQEAVDTFTDDPNCRIFLANHVAAREGLDLAVSHHILSVEGSWIPGEMEQYTDRCAGFNQTKKVSIQFMVIEKSLEENMFRTVIDKKNKIEQIIE